MIPSDLGLTIAQIERDPRTAERLQSGRFTINKELNLEWIDIRNDGPYVLNLQGRILVCMYRNGPRHAPRGYKMLRKAKIRSGNTIPLNPGQTIRLYSGEQPLSKTQVPNSLSRVIWLVQSSYLWVPAGHEAHLYFSDQDLRQRRAPIARFAWR